MLFLSSYQPISSEWKFAIIFAILLDGQIKFCISLLFVGLMLILFLAF